MGRDFVANELVQIEEAHDPRQEMVAPPDLSSILHFTPGATGNPNDHPFASLHRAAGSPHPGPPGSTPGDQPSFQQHEHTSPDGVHVSRTIRFTTGGGARGGGNAMFGGFGGGGGGGDAGRQNPNNAVHDLFHSLFTQIGGLTPDQAMQRGQAGPGQPTGATPGSPSNDPDASARSYNRGPPPEPYTRGPPPAPDAQQGAVPGGPQITRRQYNWGPFNVTMATSSNTFVNGQPVPPGEDADLTGMFQRAFAHDPGHIRQGPGRSILFATGTRGPGGEHEPGGATFGGIASPIGLLNV